MAEAALLSSNLGHAAHAAHTESATGGFARATPGKVAMWLFLGTEVMFFTGLIGTYIVLRAGSANTAYSAAFAPNAASRVALENPQSPAYAFSSWPRPFDTAVNPLNVSMTFYNTLILMSSSVTLSLAITAIQRRQQTKFRLLMLATVILGSIFLGVQVYEYYELLYAELFPIGVSASGHFTPDVSLFASCFFTMTGFHGAHVFAGVVALSALTIGAFLGKFSAEHHSAVEITGLYWHFVDLVWIILFTVVYLI